MYSSLKLNQVDQTLEISLNRPDVLNALSLELLQELKAALAAASEDKTIRAVVLTGAGRGFSAGADLTSTSLSGDVQSIVESYYNPIVSLLATMPKPVIAAINGVAAGAGLSLALACDMRVMSQQAVLTVGFTKIGLSLDAGMSFFLPRLVSRGRAFELAYSNRSLNADDALALGLVEKVLPAEGFAEAALLFAKALAQGPASFTQVKGLLNQSAANTLDEQLSLEARMQAKAAQTSDVKEGVRAFAEKRRAIFRGE
jgi:2-(1,2-epoxy-1,2-dihydrophenyl)acetyl-CoA isomerase